METDLCWVNTLSFRWHLWNLPEETTKQECRQRLHSVSLCPYKFLPTFNGLMTFHMNSQLWGPCMLSSFSWVQLFETLQTVAYQAPLSMGFSREEYRRELPFPSPGDLPNPRIRGSSWPRDWTLVPLCLLHWQAGFFLPLAPPKKPEVTLQDSQVRLLQDWHSMTRMSWKKSNKASDQDICILWLLIADM